MLVDVKLLTLFWHLSFYLCVFATIWTNFSRMYVAPKRPKLNGNYRFRTKSITNRITAAQEPAGTLEPWKLVGVLYIVILRCDLLLNYPCPVTYILENFRLIIQGKPAVSPTSLNGSLAGGQKGAGYVAPSLAYSQMGDDDSAAEEAII